MVSPGWNVSGPEALVYSTFALAVPGEVAYVSDTGAAAGLDNEMTKSAVRTAGDSTAVRCPTSRANPCAALT